ncbi:MAG: hypothetical protein HRU15_16635, partial [Planctomycetes bacterium]|nr:hypothetical protein [Planctomycetota bacterium]
LTAVEDTANHITVMDHGNVLARGSIQDLRGDKSLEESFLSLTDIPPTV